MLFYGNQLIILASQADFYGVVDAGTPVGHREGVGKVVVMAVAVGGQFISQLASGLNRHGVAGIGTGDVYRYRVEGSEHSHIRDNGQVVFRVAVTIGGNVHDDVDVELGTSLNNRFGILCNLAV